jgi:hypothetical protein
MNLKHKIYPTRPETETKDRTNFALKHQTTLKELEITLTTPMAEAPNREIFGFSKQNFESNLQSKFFSSFRAKTLFNSQSNLFFLQQMKEALIN